MKPEFGYDPKKLQRELTKYYISATDQDIQDMLETIGLKDLDSLYSHIADNNKFTKFFVSDELDYESLAQHLYEISNKNNNKISFLGDGLQNYRQTDIVGDICSIRGLTTAYTPYQPERSQGTLQSLWIYQCSIAQMTGYEAINASLYERSTCVFEAIQTAIRISKNKTTAIVSLGLYPGDVEVLNTQARHTKTKIIFAPVDKVTGLTDLEFIKNELKNNDQIAALVFPQTNCFGILEEVDQLTDIATENNIQSIALFDPILISNGALKEPSVYGSEKQGADIIVGEGQHLGLGANFGGPGLGIFGIRYNEKQNKNIRQTAGRYIGKAKDVFGRECKSIILSTREQHIRREKATSNICSNQSFIASLVGSTLLRRGHLGLAESASKARENALKTFKMLTSFGFKPLFKNQNFYNEISVISPIKTSELISRACANGIHIGVDISNRLDINQNALLVSLSDIQTEDDLKKLESFLSENFEKTNPIELNPLNEKFKRKSTFTLPLIGREEIIDYYKKLGTQNLSPDDGIYPLGSCTMKYNPYINDWAASLSGFTRCHPQAPIEDTQGCLEIIYEIQEQFKKITGLPGCTTQPVAGAQGELVGIKMFQGYHASKNQVRDLILIPKSAHGTNPATATYAGFESSNIVLINANKKGEMDIEQIREICNTQGSRVAGIMVTNPNTAGVFETNFKQMSEIIHAVDGLVYMDGANMNAIAGWVNLNNIGVDAVHNNLHKTWTIPHGGGGPGDAIVACSEKLIPFLPGVQIKKEGNLLVPFKTNSSIGSFHRHYGNFAHKVRAYTYLKALGSDGIRKMSAVAVLSARYLKKELSQLPSLPIGSEETPRMHEFIVTLNNESFDKIQKAGVLKAQAIARIGKLFLDFGFHAPTVAFPEQFGLMIEPTESFSKKELDSFLDTVKGIFKLIDTNPEVLNTVPHFTPIDRVDEVEANKTIQVSEPFEKLSEILPDRINSKELRNCEKILLFGKIKEAHLKKSSAQAQN